MQEAVDLFRAEYEKDFHRASFLDTKQSPDEWNNWSLSTKDHSIRVTADQARRFQQKQRNKIMSARKRVNQRIKAERKQLVIQKEMIKCIRGRARVAALRVAAMNTTATSSGSSSTSGSACDWIQKGFQERRPSVKKIVIMPKLHQTIVDSLVKSRDASISPNHARSSFKSARLTQKILHQACDGRDRPMTQPSSATSSHPTNHDRRKICMRGHLNNSTKENSEHMRRKLCEKKRTQTPKFKRVKNARDYVKKWSKTVINTPEKSSERYADSQMHKQNEIFSNEHKMARWKSSPQFFQDRRSSDRRRKEALREFLEVNAFANKMIQRKKFNYCTQQSTLKKKKRLQSAYGILGKSRTPTRKRLRKKCTVSARAADHKIQ